MQQLNEDKYLMVLCKDMPEDPMDFGYTLYFVNNTEEGIESLKITPEDIISDYDEKLEVYKMANENLQVGPKSYSVISNIDEMDLPFNVCYDAYIKIRNQESRKSFNIKQLDVIEMEMKNVPMINKEGYIFTSA